MKYGIDWMSFKYKYTQNNKIIKGQYLLKLYVPTKYCVTGGRCVQI